MRNQRSFPIIRLSFFLIAFILGAGHAPLENAYSQESVKPKPVTELIADLNSRKFQHRQNASDELSKRGLEIIPPVVELIFNGNTEQRYRASQILANLSITSDANHAAKMTRVLNFLADNGQPGLLELAERSKRKWKQAQFKNTVRSLRQLGAEVQTNQGHSEIVGFGRGRIILAEELEQRIETGKKEISIDKAKPSQAKESKQKPLSPKQMMASIDKILADKPSVDQVEVAKLQLKKNPWVQASGSSTATDKQIRELEERIKTISPYPPAQTSYQTVHVNKNWKGSADDFSKIALLPNVTSIKITGIDVTNDMLDVIERLPVSTVEIIRCDFDTTRVRKYAKKHPGVYVNVRGKALLGVRGPLAGGTGRALEKGPCLISEVIENSAADRAGVIVNDKILKVDDKSIATFQDLVFEIAGRKIGTSVKLTIDRRGKRKTLTLKLGDAADPKVVVDQ